MNMNKTHYRNRPLVNVNELDKTRYIFFFVSVML